MKRGVFKFEGFVLFEGRFFFFKFHVDRDGRWIEYRLDNFNIKVEYSGAKFFKYFIH